MKKHWKITKYKKYKKFNKLIFKRKIITSFPLRTSDKIFLKYNRRVNPLGNNHGHIILGFPWQFYQWFLVFFKK